MTIDSTITVENPSQDVIRWCEQNLKIRNPEYAKKVQMHFWLGDTPQVLNLFEKRGNTLVLPFGVLREILPLLHGAEVNTLFSDSPMVCFDCEVPLYDYQEEAVTACIAGHYGILQSPAGSGKTEMAIALVKRWGKRTLFLTHTLDLLKQAKDRAIMRGISRDLIGTTTEGKVSIGSGVTFATLCHKHCMSAIVQEYNSYPRGQVRRVLRNAFGQRVTSLVQRCRCYR